MLRNSIAGLPDYVSDSTPERIAKAAGLAKMTRLSFNENPVAYNLGRLTRSTSYKPPLPEPQRLMPP